MYRQRVVIVVLAAVAAVAAGSAAVYLVQQDKRVLFERRVTPDPAPSSEYWEAGFELDKSAARMHVAVTPKAAAPHLILGLDKGPDLWLLYEHCVNPKLASFYCGRDLPPGIYAVRVREDAVTTPYRVTISVERDVTPWQGLVAALGIGLALTGAAAAWRARRSGPHPSLEGFAFAWLALTAGVLFLYLLCHEGAHAAPAIAFGVWDFTASDFWGLRGMPHSSLRPDAALADWQRAVIALSGPVFPVLAGLVLTVWSRGDWGRRMRMAYPALDLFWTMTAFMFVFSQMGLVLSQLGLTDDADYANFVRYSPWPAWAAHGALAGLTAVCAAALAVLAPQLKQAVLAHIRTYAPEFGRCA